MLIKLREKLKGNYIFLNKLTILTISTNLSIRVSILRDLFKLLT
jgi:hypothetical protein